MDALALLLKGAHDVDKALRFARENMAECPMSNLLRALGDLSDARVVRASCVDPLYAAALKDAKSIASSE